MTRLGIEVGPRKNHETTLNKWIGKTTGNANNSKHKNKNKHDTSPDPDKFQKKLKKTIQSCNDKLLFGFDIETYDSNKKFLMASLYNSDIGYVKCFYNVEDFVTEIKTNHIFHDSVIVATNLSFDFFGTFFNSSEIRNFKTLFSGSSLLNAKTYLYNDMFFPYKSIKRKKLPSITFIDTCNYVKMSVSNMGQIIGYNKLKSPSCLGNKPDTISEWLDMIQYNIRDSEITFKFMKFMLTAFDELGASFKNTIAATAMSLFTNKYIGDNVYYLQDTDVLLEQFQAYYGGRTEAFARGYIEHMNYYDFNSLYPSCMVDDDYPDPNSLRISHSDTMLYIDRFEGCSHVNITCPDDMLYPVLPVRDHHLHKVLFPTGTFEGWYTHIELRYAISQGYRVNKVNKSHYFAETCSPFKSYVTDLYNKRLYYKSVGSKMELVVKLLLNSLYGKFCQKFTDTDNWVHESFVTDKDIKCSKTVERVSEFVRLVRDIDPANFCIPIWGSYISSKGRIKMHRALVSCESPPVYCDTDSIITSDRLPESTELGGLKLEMNVREGYIVKPKFYALKDKHNTDPDHDYLGYVKVKGLGKRLSYFAFTGLLNCNQVDPSLNTTTIHYDKFMKFKEAIKRDFIPNEIVEVSKEFSLEDNKRYWGDQVFDPTNIQYSVPRKVNHG